MSIQTRILAAAIALTLAGFAHAAELELAPPTAQDTIPARLSSQAAKAVATLESEPVQFAWRLDTAAALQPVAQPHLASSKEYWDRRSADELAAGVVIPTSAPGAIVRLSPVGDASAKALEARQLILRKGDQAFANGAGMQALADSETLEKGSVPFPVGSTVFRIDPALGAGRFELQVPMASGDAVVHVYEPDSPVHLDLKASRVGYQAGNEIRIEARLVDAGRARGVDEISGLITSPGGQVRELSFVADKAGGYRAGLPADFAAESGIGGLFEVQAFASAKSTQGQLLRDARTAFSYSVPSARFTGAVRTVPVRMRDPVVYVEFDVEVAAASRYQIGGVLYGTDKSGAKVPVAMAQRAERLEPGVHGMTLLFGPDVLDGASAGAPWEIRDLQLVNQADMGLQEQRIQALALDSAR
jgi:hypothetical protein